MTRRKLDCRTLDEVVLDLYGDPAMVTYLHEVITWLTGDAFEELTLQEQDQLREALFDGRLDAAVEHYENQHRQEAA